jgi:hypothetical protein
MSITNKDKSLIWKPDKDWNFKVNLDSQLCDRRLQSAAYSCARRNFVISILTIPKSGSANLQSNRKQRGPKEFQVGADFN